MAETHADIILSAAGDALRQGESLQESLAELAVSPDSIPALEAARMALHRAKTAYLQIEVAVFYSDYDSVEELLALPDPNDSSGMSREPRGFPAIETLLDAFASPPTPPAGPDEAGTEPGHLILQAMLGQTQDLVGGLRRFVAAWERNNPNNFRYRYFAASPADSIRRIFQGYTTLVGSVLPARGADTESKQPSETNTGLFVSLHALRTLYLGTYQNSEGLLIGGPGMRSLIEQTDRGIAERIDARFLHSMELSRDSERSPDTRLVRESLEALQTEWIKAARSLNLEVEEPET